MVGGFLSKTRLVLLFFCVLFSTVPIGLGKLKFHRPNLLSSCYELKLSSICLKTRSLYCVQLILLFGIDVTDTMHELKLLGFGFLCCFGLVFTVWLRLSLGDC